MTKHILIMAGGTGGHIFPGLAVADSLTEQGWQVTWLGTAERMEAQLVPKSGYPIEFIDIKGVRNKGLLRKLTTPLMVLNAVMQARKIIRKVKPDIIIGFGGYAALPGGIAAKISGIPLVIHEQNAAAGLTNKVLSKIATQVLTAFSHVKGLAKPAKVVGNPIRQQIKSNLVSHRNSTNEDKNQDKDHAALNILVVGGSLGAQVLNQQVPLALQKITAHNTINVHHQVGSKQLALAEQAYAAITAQNIQYQLVEFIDDMAAAYHSADLVICRAGALTVSELAQVGVASILVPLPHAVDDHQTKNAQVLVNANAGVLLPQNKLEQGELSALLNRLIQHPEQLEKMAQACQAVAMPQSTQLIVAQIKALTTEVTA